MQIILFFVKSDFALSRIKLLITLSSSSILISFAIVNEKRKRTLEDWNEGINRLKQLGCKTNWMKAAGFFPQVVGKDNWSKLVQVK